MAENLTYENQDQGEKLFAKESIDYKGREKGLKKIEKPASYQSFIWTFVYIIVFSGLYLTSFHSYLLFHSLAEIFGIIVACGTFMVAWNARHFIENNYILLIGIAYLFVGSIDTLHTLAYQGMGIFKDYGANLSTQLWVSARYIESLSFLIAPHYIAKKLRANSVFFGFLVVFGLLMGSIFYWHVFPDCFVEGSGLTPFKKISEYIISLVMVGAGVRLFQQRKAFEESIFRFLLASIVITIGAELAFTLYVTVHGFFNLIGHFLKLISFYLIYKVVIETGLVKPYSLLFRNLMKSKETLQMKSYELGERVKNLDCLYGIAGVREKKDNSLEETFQEIVELIPPSWQYPDITCSRVILESKEFKTENFKETIWKQTTDIISHGECVGSVEVCYLEEKPERYEGPFLKEERDLIDAIAERLGKIIEHERAAEALEWELRINSALSDLYKPLISPSASIEDISNTILTKALSITGSKHGYVSSIDAATRDAVAHTLTEMLKGECKVTEENKKISFPCGKNGVYPRLWGYSLNTHEGFFTNSPKAHKAFTGLPEGHIPIERFLSVPVMLGTELVGQISLANKEEDYTEQDLAGISRLSEYFALAIQQRQAQDSLQEARDELEARVKERTAQLLKTNKKLKREVEERKQTENSLKRSKAELRRLSSRLLDAHEEESKRIGQELHDGLAQTLSAIKVWGENALIQSSESSSVDSLDKSLQSVVHLAQGAVEEVRRILRNLRPSMLDDLGILATISWLCQEFETIYSGIGINKEIDIEENEVPDFLKIVIFRIVQEALNNIAKHSKATRARLSLKRAEDNVELSINDEGTGFDVEHALPGGQPGTGFGLASIRERSELSGGSFTIESRKGAGTTIRVSWPYHDLQASYTVQN